MTLAEKLKAKKAALAAHQARLKELKTLAASRELTEAEETEIDQIAEENEAFRADISSIEKRMKALAMDEGGGSNPSGGRKSTPLPPGSVEVGEPNFVKDPKKGFKSVREYTAAVIAATVDRKSDERLNYLSATRIEAAAGSDEQSGFADPYGGFFVPTGLAPGVLQIDPEPDPMVGRTTMVPMDAPKVSFNARVDKDHSSSVSGGFTVTRRAEAQDAQSSRGKFEQVELSADSLFGLAYATEELINDSPSSFAAIIQSGFNQQFISHLIDERLNGSGAGMYQGIRNSGAMITVAKETGQPADSIVVENIYKMRARCWRYENAVWLANHDCLPQIFALNTGVTDAPRLVQTLGSDVPDLLLGRPLIFTEYTETIGDVGDLVLANWSQYLEGIYQPMQSSESVHVRYIQHERVFKFWIRNAGASWWKTPLTPKKGASTLSPFVQLAARA